MLQTIHRATLLACALGVSLSIPAQQPAADATRSDRIELRYAAFDPLLGEPAVPAGLRDQGNLWIVQFAGVPTQRARDAVMATGARLHGYLPHNAYVVRMSPGAAAAVGRLPDTRWVGRYHAAYRLDPALIAELENGGIGEVRRYNIVVTDKHTDKPALAANVQAMGGIVVSEEAGSLLFSVALTGAQLQQAATFDEVLWIDRWGAPEEDMDNARIQGGGNYVEAQAGYTGSGLNAHIYEGIEASHPAFSGPVINVLSSGSSTSHGTSTAGIVFGDGTGRPQFRGMAPDVGKFYTTYGSVSTSRWQVVSDLVNVHNVSHTTASWGDPRTLSYTSVSADADDIIFDHDIPWTQSQSNAHNQMSRPQAWAKNIFSGGAVDHFDNSNPGDDSWQSGGGSTGPAADGRIKPTLSAYYDSIGTTTTGGSYTTSFGGTSGATPIIAGHNVLAIQMFTDDSASPGVGPFGNQLRSPGASSHVNRPHFTTLKALQVASASQWPFAGANVDNSRMKVGWGFPNLQTMWDLRAKTHVVDETDILTQGNSKRWDVNVGPGEPALKAVLNYAEPAANPSASITLINDLSLKVTAPSGTVYWGNNALDVGNWSVAGGSEDHINPIECVFVQNPAPGVWHIDVIATAVVADNHIETPAVDADYGLVVTGGTGQPSTSAFFVKYGQGCAGTTSTVSPCAELNSAGGTLAGPTNALEYCIIVPTTSPMDITSVSFFTRSTGGTQSCPVRIYTALTAWAAPIASATLTVGPTLGSYTATFPAPVSIGGAFFLTLDLRNPGVLLPNLTMGQPGSVFSRAAPGSSWNFEPLVNRPAYRVDCTAGTVYDVPILGNNGDPVLGTTYDITLSDALASAPAFIVTGYSDEVFGSTQLPYPLPNAPGCELLAAPMATHLIFTSATGTASEPFAVPSAAAFIGIEMFHQWAILDAANSLGIVVSDAGKAHLGT